MNEPRKFYRRLAGLSCAFTAMLLAGCFATGGKATVTDSSGLAAVGAAGGKVDASASAPITASPGSCFSSHVIEGPTTFGSDMTITAEQGVSPDGSRYSRSIMSTNPNVGFAQIFAQGFQDAFKAGLAVANPAAGAANAVRTRGPTTSPEACGNDVAGLQWVPDLGLPEKLQATE